MKKTLITLLEPELRCSIEDELQAILIESAATMHELEAQRDSSSRVTETWLDVSGIGLALHQEFCRRYPEHARLVIPMRPLANGWFHFIERKLV